ncbi:C6 zinc finger domain protein, partial [Aspergillus carlsbadensis]
MEIYASRSAGVATPVEDASLNMDSLLSMQFFHLHTAHEMSLDAKRTMVWRRVIPELAANHCYLMHLLLALGGIHMITEQTRQGRGERAAVDLLVVMDHHQRGLQGYTEEVARISQCNAEAVYAGSLLLVAFVYASLQIPELNPFGTALNQEHPGTIYRPHLRWLHLIRGVSTVVVDQWAVLKASRMRPMVLYFHGVEYWDDLPFASSVSNLSCCSPRFSLFARGTDQAIAGLRASSDVIQPPDGSGLRLTPGYSPATSEEAGSGLSTAIDVLEKLYSRVVAVLKCSVSERGSPDDSDLQANLEEAAVQSWPSLVPGDFIASLDVGEPADPGWGLSLVILAHYYVVNTLIDRGFLAAFKEEVLKIQSSVANLHNAQLSRLMIWPVNVAIA